MTTTYLPEIEVPATSARVWTGRVLSAIAVLFLTMDAVVHLLRPAVAVDGTVKLGFSADVLLPLGIIQVISLILYLYPRTSMLGAVIWTGYLGGAVATHVRIADPLFTHILAPVYVAALLWAGLALRDRRVIALFK
jgi:hypothetical protein